MSAWTRTGDDGQEGTQIDLLIERKDNVVNMCEMKFYNEEFNVDKDYYMTLMRRHNILSQSLPRRSVVHNVLISTYGQKYGKYSGVFQNTITMDDLFRNV